MCYLRTSKMYGLYGNEMYCASKYSLILVFELCVSRSNAIRIGEKMKNILKEATEKFESKFCTNIPIKSEEMAPSTVKIAGQHLTSTHMFVTSWDIYVTDPYILWDPLTQYHMLFEERKLKCPLCSADGALSNVLKRSGKWLTGHSARSTKSELFSM